MSHPNRVARRLTVALAFPALLLAGAATQAKTVAAGRCSVNVPDNWASIGPGASSPGGRVVASLGETPNGAASTAMAQATGGTVLPNPRLVMVRTAGAQGSSRYFAITTSNPQPACTVQVTSRDSGADGAAASVAASLRRGAAAATTNDDRGDRDGPPDRRRRRGRGDRDEERSEDRDDFSED